MILKYPPLSDVINSWVPVGDTTAFECVNEGCTTPNDADYIAGYSRSILDVQIGIGGAVLAQTAPVSPVSPSTPGFGSNPSLGVATEPQFDGNSVIVTWEMGTIAYPNTFSNWKVRIRAKRNLDTFPLPGFKVVLSQINNIIWEGVPQETDYGHGEFKTFELEIDKDDLAELNGVVSGEAVPHVLDFENIRLTLQFINYWTNNSTIDVSAVELETPEIQGFHQLTNSSIELLQYNGVIRPQLTASSIEVLNKKGNTRITLSSIEVLAEKLEALQARLTSSSIEYLQKIPTPRTTSSSIEVLSTLQSTRITSSSIEYLQEYDPPTQDFRLTQSTIEVLFEDYVTLSSDTCLITSSSIEMLGKPPVRQVVPVSYLKIPGKIFLANWQPGVNLETNWETRISVSVFKETEQRLSVRKRPFRTIIVTLFGLTKSEAVKLASYLRNMGENGIPFPLYSDATKLTSAVSVGAKQLPCDTTYRRFWKGQRIALVSLVNNVPSILDFYTIDKVQDEKLILTNPIKYGFAANSRVYPCIDVHRIVEASAEPLTPEVYSLSIEATEKIGEMTLLPWADSSVYDTYNNRDIFGFFNARGTGERQGTRQVGEIERLGKGSVDSTILETPKDTFTGTLVFTSRANFFRYLNFFNKHRGRAIQFIFPVPQPFFDLIEYNSEYLVLSTNQIPDNWLRFMVAVHMRDETIHVREWATLGEVDPDTYKWTFYSDESLTIDESQIRYIGLAYYARYANDYIEEAWTHDNFVQVPYAVVKIPKDQSYSS